MKEINAHVSKKWNTIPVYINGNILHLAIFPLQYRGAENRTAIHYAYWGDPDNRDKLAFVVGIGYNSEVGFFVPHSFIDPSTKQGASQLEAIIAAELHAYDNPEAAQLDKECKKLRKKLAEQQRLLFKKASH
ncbi:MAG: hypothetical protein IKK85_09220 [Clostridia bacterium]|nr:hypothetical protein [Clostridia bacterium]